MRTHQVAQNVVLLAVLAATAGGCSKADVEPIATQASTPEPAPQMEKAQDGPYQDDGSLRPAGQQVFGAPAPRALTTVDIDPGAAGYESPHSYRNLINFYESQLDDTWTRNHAAGGARFSSKNDKARIYVQKPRQSGQQPRVFYFGDGNDLKAAPRLGQAGLASAAAGQTPPPAASPKEAPASSSLYRAQRAKRGGKDVIVYSRTDPQPGTRNAQRDDLTRYEQPPGYDPFAGQSVYIPVPKGVLH